LENLGLQTAGRSRALNLHDMSLEEVESLLVGKALARYNGNVSQAAEVLGLSRGSFYRRMEKNTAFYAPDPREKKSDRVGSRRTLVFELRLLWSVLLTGFPAVVLSLFLLWKNPYSLDHQLEGTPLLLLFWLGMSISTRDEVVRSIQVLSNVIAAVKEEDFSFRATETVPGDAFGELAIEINNLARALEEERLGNTEAAICSRRSWAKLEQQSSLFRPIGGFACSTAQERPFLINRKNRSWAALLMNSASGTC